MEQGRFILSGPGAGNKAGSSAAGAEDGGGGDQKKVLGWLLSEYKRGQMIIYDEASDDSGDGAKEDK